MKTFKHLTFKKREFGLLEYTGSQAKMFFKNGYGVSVITGFGAYGNESNPYEVAVIMKSGDGFEICYNTPITDDVIGYCNEEDVTEIMKKVQEL